MKTRNTLNWLGLVIGLLCGLFWLVFVVGELATPEMKLGYAHNPWGLGLGISILVLTLAGRFFPRIGSPLLIVVGLAGVAYALNRPMAPAVNVSVALTLGAPMIVAGVFFLIASAFSKRTSKA
jgi:hypothetical protein